ncbi:MAG: ATP synthase F1 subunit epsilon [Rhodospirillales bacterium]
MADTIEFELVSPERLVTSEPVEMAVVPLAEGDIGVLPGHSLLIGALRPGAIDIHAGGKVTKRIFVSGGVCEVSPERCTVLAEEAASAEDISRDDAEKRLAAAKAALDAAGSGAGNASARARAEAELKTAEAMAALAAA